MPRFLFVLAVAGVSLHSVSAQTGSRPPVIDMHVHSTTTRQSDLARLASLNVRYVFLAALQSDLAPWSAVEPARYLPALVFPCAGRRAPITGRPCFDTTNRAALPQRMSAFCSALKNGTSTIVWMPVST
jgi:hypothetical protein